eukprot:UN08435
MQKQRPESFLIFFIPSFFLYGLDVILMGLSQYTFISINSHFLQSFNFHYYLMNNKYYSFDYTYLISHCEIAWLAIYASNLFFPIIHFQSFF